MEESSFRAHMRFALSLAISHIILHNQTESSGLKSEEGVPVQVLNQVMPDLKAFVFRLNFGGQEIN